MVAAELSFKSSGFNWPTFYDPLGDSLASAQAKYSHRHHQCTSFRIKAELALKEQDTTIYFGNCTCSAQWQKTL